MAASQQTLDRETIVADLAEVLGIPSTEISDEDNIADLGLDSVRLMSLIEKWRAAGAERADFVTLSSDPRVGAWVTVLSHDPGSSDPA